MFLSYCEIDYLITDQRSLILANTNRNNLRETLLAMRGSARNLRAFGHKTSNNANGHSHLLAELRVELEQDITIVHLK